MLSNLVLKEVKRINLLATLSFEVAIMRSTIVFNRFDTLLECVTVYCLKFSI